MVTKWTFLACKGPLWPIILSCLQEVQGGFSALEQTAQATWVLRRQYRRDSFTATCTLLCLELMLTRLYLHHALHRHTLPATLRASGITHSLEREPNPGALLTLPGPSRSRHKKRKKHKQKHSTSKKLRRESRSPGAAESDSGSEEHSPGSLAASQRRRELMAGEGEGGEVWRLQLPDGKQRQCSSLEVVDFLMQCCTGVAAQWLNALGLD